MRPLPCGVVAVRWIDNHCHLDRDGDGETGADALVADARAAGVERLIVVGTDLASSRAAVATAARHPGVWATVGLHPHDATDGLDGLEELLAAPQVVAVGECGFDLHYEHSPRDAQRGVFAAQVGWAHEHDQVLMIHTREAWDETFAVLDAEGVPERTVFHCFTGGPDEARACLDRGALLSFSGIVTFRSADAVRAAAAACPLDRVLVETDSPFLAPVPYRGRANRPALVPVVGEAVAGAMDVPVEAVAEATWANAERVYRLPA
jgi:TatD DNase family protein